MASLNEEPKITFPSVGPIIRIHRSPDGYVAFGRKLDEEQWENLPSIKIERLKTMFPAFVEQLVRDSYFSLDTFLTPTREYKRYLNCCWVDIDLHGPREIQTIGTRYGKILDMVQDGILPRPSLTVYSGRGLWVLWFLTEQPDSNVPPRAFPEKCLAQEGINRRLADLLNADAQGATVQMLRVPGSTNTKAEPGHELVQFRFLLDVDENQRGAVYTLEGLGQLLGLDLPSLRRHSLRSESSRALVGMRALWAQRLDALRALSRARGGFREGCRNRAAYYYGAFLRGYGMDEKSTLAAMQTFGSECHPPLKRQQILSAFHQSKRNRGLIRDSTISRQLGVTVDEGKLVPEWAPDKFKGEVKPIDMAYSNRDRIALRKHTIFDIVQELGRWPGTRTMARLLAQRGMPVSHVQVSRYYREMKPSPRPCHPSLSLLTSVT